MFFLLLCSVKTNTRIIHIAGDDVPLDDALLDDDDGKENQHRLEMIALYNLLTDIKQK